MSFSLAAGAVAYEEDSAAIQRLTGGRSNGAGFTTGSNTTRIDYYALAPQLMNRLHGLASMAYLGSGNSLMTLTGSDDNLLFLHSRRAPGHEPRLVCVRLNNFFLLRQGHAHPGLGSIMPGTSGTLDWFVVKPGTLQAPPSIAAKDHWNDFSFNSGLAAPLRVYLGQPDPTDESHFTIDFQTPGGYGRVDGWMQSDDTLKLSTRNHP